MFAFLLPAKPQCVGIEVGINKLVAVVLDEKRNLLSRQELACPASQDLIPVLQTLVSQSVKKTSSLVMSLPFEYHIKAIDLPEVTPAAIRLEAERYLPYQVDEARFGYCKMSQTRAVVVSCPVDVLLGLAAAIRPFRPRTVAFEAPEMAHLRILGRAGLPGGVLEVHGPWLRATAFSGQEFTTFFQELTAQNTAEVCIDRFLGTLDFLKRPRPGYFLTNLSCQWLTGLTRVESRALGPDDVAAELALSPPGPHRFEESSL